MYNYNSFDSAAFGIIIILILVAIAISITIAVLYLLTLQNVLKEIAPQNRLVEPSSVWLMFIPLFNLIYPFILYPKISESLRNEYNFRGIGKVGDYGRGIGITMPILGLCGWIPIIGGLAGLANLILFIIFWVKMSEFKNELKKSPKTNNGVSNNNDLLD